MALNIKDPETDRLAAEVAALTGQTKAKVVKVALAELRKHLAARAASRDRSARLRQFLTEEAWPQLPNTVRGVPISRQEREEILGYGPEGV